MPRSHPVLPAFTGGEVSTRLSGRVDLQRYQTAVKTCENFIVFAQGGATRRPGTGFIAGAKNDDKRARLLPFEFSLTQSYNLEFGEEYVRFFAEGAPVVSGMSPYEISSPYEEADLPSIAYTQSADVLYLMHPMFPQQKLSRFGHTDWTMADAVYVDGPFLTENDTATTLTASATTGSITLAASAALFQAGHVGALFRMRVGNDWGCVRITAVTDSTNADATVERDLPGGATSPIAEWSEGAWSDVRGYPYAMAILDQRAIYLGNSPGVVTLWGSRLGEFENFDDGTGAAAAEDSAAFTYALGQLGPIPSWILPKDGLLIGTQSVEFFASSTNDGPITPTNVKIRPTTRVGSNGHAPLDIGAQTLTVDRSGRRLQEISYSFNANSLVTRDLTVTAEHISRGGFSSLQFLEVPWQSVMAVRGDGVLCGLTYQPAEEVIAWWRMVTDGEVEDVCAIPASDGTADELWLLVKRTIDGGTVRYVERLLQPHEPEDEDDKDGYCFLDSSLSYSGAPATAFSGLDHLEGEEVSIFADGKVHPALTVASGAITLDYAASEVHVGLPFTSRFKTLRIEGGVADGTAQGRKKRIAYADVRFENTLGGKMGTNEDRLEPINFATGADALSQSPPLFTGDKRVRFLGGFGTDGQLTIVQDEPLPMTILAIMPVLNVTEG